MAIAKGHRLNDLFERDETAWLEAMAALAAEGRLANLDLPNLAEYRTDLARRERREVFSRLVELLTHLLKWDHQPRGRNGSWCGTIREQRRELRQLFESGTLCNHAAAVLTNAYAEARQQAADEMGVDAQSFPLENPWTVEEALGDGDA